MKANVGCDDGQDDGGIDDDDGKCDGDRSDDDGDDGDYYRFSKKRVQLIAG